MIHPPQLITFLPRRLSRRRCCVALAAALLASLTITSLAAVARADTDDDDDAPAAPAAAAAVQNQFVLTPQTLDQWIFGGVQIRDGRYDRASQMDLRCQAQLEMRLDAIDRICTLSAAQTTKLRLVADGDFKHFREAYDEFCDKYLNSKQNPNDVNQIYIALQPLRNTWQAGILGDQSLFQKVLETTLQPPQLEAFHEEETARIKDYYLAKIKLAVASLDNSLALTAGQRESFEKLLSETPPPKKFGQQAYYYVLVQISRLPQEKLKAIFDARQWKAIQQIRNRGKGYEQMLIQQGIM